MTWKELTQDQKIKAKQDYMLRLADKGRFVATIYGDGSEERDPSMGELADADVLVPDDVIKECAGVGFVPEDFVRPENAALEDVKRRISEEVTPKGWMAEHDKLEANCDIEIGIKWAAGKSAQIAEEVLNGQDV